MTNSDKPEMPWGMIFKRTGQLAILALAVFTGLGAANTHQLRLEKEESERFRWTDKNRWE